MERQRGSTLFELVTVMAVVAIFAADRRAQRGARRLRRLRRRGRAPARARPACGAGRGAEPVGARCASRSTAAATTSVTGGRRAPHERPSRRARDEHLPGRRHRVQRAWMGRPARVVESARRPLQRRRAPRPPAPSSSSCRGACDAPDGATAATAACRAARLLAARGRDRGGAAAHDGHRGHGVRRQRVARRSVGWRGRWTRDRAVRRVAERLRSAAVLRRRPIRSRRPSRRGRQRPGGRRVPARRRLARTRRRRATWTPPATTRQPRGLVRHAVDRGRRRGPVRRALPRRAGRPAAGSAGGRRLGRAVRRGEPPALGARRRAQRRQGPVQARGTASCGSALAVAAPGADGRRSRMSTCSRGGRALAGARGGFTLVELLVAAAVAAVVLAAAYGWLWNVAALAGRADDRAQAATLAVGGCRARWRGDVRAAVAVVARHPPAATLRASLALVHDHVGRRAPRTCSSSGTRLAGWCGATRPARTSPTTSPGSRSTYVLADGRWSRGDEHVRADWERRPVPCASIWRRRWDRRRSRRSLEVAVGPS